MKTQIKLTTVELTVAIEMLVCLGINYQKEWKNDRYTLVVDVSPKWSRVFIMFVREEIKRRKI